MGTQPGAPPGKAGLPENGRRRGAGLRLLLLTLLLSGAVLASFFIGRYPITGPQLFAMLLARTEKALTRLVNAAGGLFGARPVARLFRVPVIWEPAMETIMVHIRLPRVLTAMLVGCCLSAAGASYQGVFRNPMASPDILGASSGACCGAVLAILLGLSRSGVIALAFCFSLTAVFLAFVIGQNAPGKRVINLILAGIMLSSLLNAGVSAVKLAADPSNQLPEITYWLMGSLSGARLRDVGFAAVPMALGLVPLLLVRWRINLLTLGDEEARAMGVNTARIRLVVILASTLVTAASISVSGMVGWVGLVIPHLGRRMVGNDYRALMPASMLAGAAFLLLVDDVSRSLLATELPIGILTAVIGAPFFIYLMSRKEAVSP